MIKIYTDSLHRIAYSTDASVYREIPVGVAYPETVNDIIDLIDEARKRKTSLIPRAAGTSIAGQVVGNGIVVDIKGWNKIIEINPKEKWARVQPGVVRDELNIALKPFGLHFSPETSTSNRCCIGGMFGNNSCGSHSLIYGSTRHHVLEAKIVLADGSIEEIRNTTIAELELRFGISFWTQTGHSSLIESIYSQLIKYANDSNIVALIDENYPDSSLKRRSCGYALDEVIYDLVHSDKPFSERSINLCKLLAGSEGTLAFTLEIKVSLDPLPPAYKMVVCAHCNSIDDSFLVNLMALRHNPVAVELMDGKILELSVQNLGQNKNIFFVNGHPAALIIAEFWGDSKDYIDASATAFESEVIKSGLVYTCTRVYGTDVSKVWDLRKAGLGVLNGMKGDAKPVGVVEDTAVNPERLPAYMNDFKLMLERLKTSCVYYGHISTGELHLRPILNIKTPDGKKLFRDIANETAILVRKHKGSLSGEHGDGRLRGEFIPIMYGEKVYQLMRDVKYCWDTDGIFNAHKIIDTPPMDEWLRYAVGQKYAIESEVPSNQTYYNWRAPFDECKVEKASGVSSMVSALMCSIEQCNGAGACLKSHLIGGTMCPAYMVSQNEALSTRARANVLREILTQGFESKVFSGVYSGKSVFDIPELKEVLDSCLACKGCLSECPSNIDMTKLRSEILQQEYDKHGVPFRSWMVARMPIMEEIGAKVRPLYNFFATWKVSSFFIKKIIRFSVKRNIPILSRYSMRKLVATENIAAKRNNNIAVNGKKVFLFADEFTNHQESELGLVFARLLIRLGYSVETPKHVESGRAAISKGCLKLAKKYAIKNVELLSNVVSSDVPLVGIEPSCILSFRDEYPDLVPAEMRSKAKALSKNCLLFDEFLKREIDICHIDKSSFDADELVIWLHGHCHQKSLIGVDNTVDTFRLLLNAVVNVIPSGCCGMAGSFGYEKEHYDTSMSIGEMVLFPTVRRVTKDNKRVIVSAPGTSCRQQILDGTGVRAYHPIEILYNHLK